MKRKDSNSLMEPRGVLGSKALTATDQFIAAAKLISKGRARMA